MTLWLVNDPTQGGNMTDFKNLNGYEKGLAARSLLQDLAKRGRLSETGSDSKATEFIVPMSRRHLELLEFISQETLPSPRDTRKITSRRHIAADEPSAALPKRWLSWGSIVLNP